MIGDTKFKRLIPESGIATEHPDKVEKLIICSGKVYYELIKERERRSLQDRIAIARLEQISPFPFDLIFDELNKYSDAAVQWVQEEHKNMGAWFYVEPRVNNLIRVKLPNHRKPKIR